MIHLDLFSGIGGFALACQWAGIETIGFVEIDKYCQKVLKKHWPDVLIVEDIRNVEEIKQIVTNATSIGFSPRCGDRQGRYIQTDIGTASQGEPQGQRRLGGARSVSSNGASDKRIADNNQPIILITAGFPCQPFSVAGKRQGEADDRYLWPETLAVIEAVKPQWILLENVAGIINLALDTVLSDLESAGYSTETLIIPACAVNAWHRRDRVWIIAYSNENSESAMPINDGTRQGQLGITAHTKRTRARENNGGIRQRISGIGRGQESVIADTPKIRFKGNRGLATRKRVGQEQKGTHSTESGWWAVEPQLGRVAHGIPNRVDRLKCLGNAIVPQVAYEIIRVIRE